MASRRLLYLAALALCGIFYIAYGQWLSCLILTATLGLPWFSLLISLPAILRFRAAPAGPSALEMGDEDDLWLLGSCGFPMPPFQGKLRLKHLISGKTWHYHQPEDLQTHHCGGIHVTVEGLKVCDYLGLFSFPARCREGKTILIRPRPVPITLPQDLQQGITPSWKPKSGGGYAENHELRLYRPGDNLNQVHWKLSAKTGDLIIREPMEAQRGLILLTVNLRGTPEELDRKLGRLLWLGNHLLDQDVPFQLRTLTGEGILTHSIQTEAELKKAIDALLCSSAAKEGDLRQRDYAASWHCHIGGEPDET